jgi:type IV fimbrial biogenesis protein FimT
MRSAGYSLLELLMTLMLAALLFGAGIPALRWLVLDSRRTTAINAFVSAVQLARSESAATGAAVTVCPSLDGQVCAYVASGFDSGWIVFADLDRDRPPERDADEPLLQSFSPRMAGTIRANRNAFQFRPNFHRGTNGTVIFCDDRGSAAARAVVISYTGRPRLADTGPGGRPLVCPGSG